MCIRDSPLSLILFSKACLWLSFNVSKNPPSPVIIDGSDKDNCCKIPCNNSWLPTETAFVLEAISLLITISPVEGSKNASAAAASSPYSVLTSSNVSIIFVFLPVTSSL